VEDNKRQQKLVLIVEDEAALRMAVGDILQAEGFAVLQATNGLEGLNTALKEHPDLILLDLMMPVMDGLTMLEKLRADEWGKNVPVFPLTNNNSPEAIAQATKFGPAKYGPVDFHMKSDWNLGDIVQKIKKVLEVA